MKLHQLLIVKMKKLFKKHWIESWRVEQQSLSHTESILSKIVTKLMCFKEEELLKVESTISWLKEKVTSTIWKEVLNSYDFKLIFVFSYSVFFLFLRNKKQIK